MIEHKIRHHIIFFRKPVNVFPGSELRFHDIVVDDGKAPVPGGRKKGKDMQAPDDILKLFVKDLFQFF